MGLSNSFLPAVPAAACLGRLLRTLATLTLALLVPLRAAQAAGDPVACPPAPRPLTADALQTGLDQAKDHGFLWRLTKDGHSSFLYGTIHAARFEWMFPGPLVLQAIRDSDSLALELDILDPEIQRRLLASIGPSRPDPLPPGLVRRIEQRMALECVDAATFKTFAPEFQIASLTVMAARRDGFDPAYAIDLVLALVARQLGKPILSLETPEGQMRALKMPTQAETIAVVQSGLDELETGRARPVLKRIADVWTGSDYADLERYATWCDCMNSAPDRQAMKRLLDDRNPALASAIDALHVSGKRLFAAVGSLHMIGPSGLPALLRRRGYTVEQGSFGR
ncbi:MAG: TraB/GumN family protein [Caldimonas sp.]